MGEIVRLVPDIMGAGAKITSNSVLAGGRKARLESCVVIGFDGEGLLYFASTDGPAETLWLLEEARRALFED